MAKYIYGIKTPSERRKKKFGTDCTSWRKICPVRNLSGFAVRVPGYPLFVTLFILLASLFTFSCRRYNTQQPAQDAAVIENRKKEVLLRVNRQLVEEDAAEIKAFAERSGWKMQTTGSGLWYMIYRSGQGEKAAEGKVATLAYTVSLLDGTLCYSSEQSGPKVFRLGQGGVEAGLEEGILLMRTGDKARLIMPPHLAHGLAGDGNRIPKRAIILYHVELLRLQ
ncbi:MAG: FKBP-type peptidyl-prolyl cis-trans isomerase [Bacteroidales bacterium]|jgi:FKBP-type peptidyl-prolyl cis-trans isomerase|nr:FKBP-type peptidyl-prolyl cis-trans isomerase [Bacteroidales bacterium]